MLHTLSQMKNRPKITIIHAHTPTKHLLYSITSFEEIKILKNAMKREINMITERSDLHNQHLCVQLKNR